MLLLLCLACPCRSLVKSSTFRCYLLPHTTTRGFSPPLACMRQLFHPLSLRTFNLSKNLNPPLVLQQTALHARSAEASCLASAVEPLFVKKPEYSDAFYLLLDLRRKIAPLLQSWIEQQVSPLRSLASDAASPHNARAFRTRR